MKEMKSEEKVSKEVNALDFRMTKLANDLGTSKVTNIVSLGVLASVCDVVTKEYLAKGVEKVLGAKKKDLLPLNLKALDVACAGCV